MLAASAALPASAGAVREVDANGNFLFASQLRFVPADITVPLGETVRWRNTDFFVPHTATEVHGLWNLTGTYGATPISPPGFGPGATVERRFESGTHRYLCIVHPEPMRGTVAVAPTLRRGTVRRRVTLRRRGRRPRRVTRRVRVLFAEWAPAAPAAGLAFDVERRRGNGPWRPYLSATRRTGARFDSGRRGTRWELRARLRRPGGDAVDWSPATALRS